MVAGEPARGAPWAGAVAAVLGLLPQLLLIAPGLPLGPQVESRSVVAAGALVTPGTVIPSGQVWAGSPAKFLRNLMEGGAERGALPAAGCSLKAVQLPACPWSRLHAGLAEPGVGHELCQLASALPACCAVSSGLCTQGCFECKACAARHPWPESPGASSPSLSSHPIPRRML